MDRDLGKATSERTLNNVRRGVTYIMRKLIEKNSHLKDLTSSDVPDYTDITQNIIHNTMDQKILKGSK